MTRASKRFRVIAWTLLLGSILGWTVFFKYGRWLWVPVYYSLRGRRTVEQAINSIDPRVERSLQVLSASRGVEYPPRAVTLLAFKEEKSLETWVRADSQWVQLKTYKILGASGTSGPKLREGDRQVPEGVYRIEGLNPNSSYHLSMKVDYPNNADRSRAKKDGRTSLGGDIFIHGSKGSVGCLAMGDDSIEELFVLVYRAGKDNVSVVISPRDLRDKPPPVPKGPLWIPEVYAELAEVLAAFPKGQPQGQKPNQAF